jgi:hypothetical protein
MSTLTSMLYNSLICSLGFSTLRLKLGYELHTRTIPLVNRLTTLWTLGSTISPPDSLTPRFLFQFHLPSGLPPSFCPRNSTLDAFGLIKYFIKVTGKRHGRESRRIYKVFPVVSGASPDDISNKNLLMGGWSQALSLSGWNQGWNSFKLENRTRKWPWGDYSHVYAEVCVMSFRDDSMLTAT